MTAKSMTVNEKERKKEACLFLRKKSYECIGGYQSRGTSSRGGAQGKFRSQDSQDEEKAEKIYSASDGQTNDVKRGKKPAKYETEYRSELAGSTTKKFSQLSV